MKLIAKRDFSSTVCGNVVEGQELELVEKQARHLLESDVCYEAKIDQPTPVLKKQKKKTAK